MKIINLRAVPALAVTARGWESCGGTTPLHTSTRGQWIDDPYVVLVETQKL